MPRGLDRLAMQAVIDEPNPSEIHRVQNWFDELRRLLPAEQ